MQIRRKRPILGARRGLFARYAAPLALGCATWGCAESTAPKAASPNAAAPEASAPVFDRERAWSDLETIVAFGERVSGSHRIENLRTFLTDELRAVGLEPVVERFTDENTPIGAIEFANVYADLPGAEREGAPTPMVILGTHFDTKRMQFEFDGANDGGSGTAVLLGLARMLAAESEPRPVTYRILFLDGEEAVRPTWHDPDNRYGSRYHAQALEAAGRAPEIGAFILLDMVGDRDLQFFEDSYSDAELRQIAREAARRIGLGRHVGGRAEAVKDDHLSFLAIDVPSLNLIDLDYGPGNSYWHSPNDTLENVSAESLEATARIVWAALPSFERFALDHVR